MGLVIAILAAGAVGALAGPWVKRIVGARTNAPLSPQQRRWVSPLMITAGSAAAGAAWSFPGVANLKLTIVASGVIAWWLLCIDAAIHRLPDPLVALLALTLAAGYLSMYLTDQATDSDVMRSALAGVVAMFGFALLALSRREAMGFGDVKLAGALGLGTGWLGWDALGQWVVLSFLLGGAFAVLMLVTRRIGPRESIAFGPWMILAAAGVLALSTLPGVTD